MAQLIEPPEALIEHHVRVAVERHRGPPVAGDPGRHLDRKTRDQHQADEPSVQIVGAVGRHAGVAAGARHRLPAGAERAEWREAIHVS
ncbi:MAG: hypothetical protein RJQ08_11405 [Salinisphaeraceae bacterium]